MTFAELERGYYRGTQVVLFKENAGEQIETCVEQGIPLDVLFVVTKEGDLLVSTTDKPLTPKAGQGAIVLIEPAPHEDAPATIDPVEEPVAT
jgi:hypothetical protein